MTRIWFLSFLFLCGATYAADPPPTGACSLSRLASIDLSIGDDGVPVVPVTINGKDVFLILDTINGPTLIRTSALAELEIGNGTTRPQRVNAAAFTIGGLEYSKMEFTAVNIPINESYVGVLGTNAFGNLDVEINLQEKKLNIFSQDHCPGQVVYWAKEFDVIPLHRDPTGKLSFDVELDGQLIRTGFSTAMRTSFMAEIATRRLFGFDSESEDIEKVRDENGSDVSHFRSMAIASNGLKIMNAKIRITKQRSTCRLVVTKNQPTKYANCIGPQPFSMGADVLSKLRIYLATKEKKMYFTVNGAG